MIACATIVFDLCSATTFRVGSILSPPSNSMALAASVETLADEREFAAHRLQLSRNDRFGGQIRRTLSRPRPRTKTRAGMSRARSSRIAVSPPAGSSLRRRRAGSAAISTTSSRTMLDGSFSGMRISARSMPFRTGPRRQASRTGAARHRRCPGCRRAHHLEAGELRTEIQRGAARSKKPLPVIVPLAASVAANCFNVKRRSVPPPRFRSSVPAAKFT